MRRTMSAGLVLAGAAVGMTLLSDLLDLGLESVALLGLALGAVVALVPDTTAARRLTGFLAGFLVALVGYFVRAGFLPDSATGRAVAVGVVVVLCAAAVAASAGRLRLWSVLLGAAALAGAYELTYAAAPPEIVETSLSTGTSLLLAVAVGFVVAGLLPGSRDGQPAPAEHVRNERDETPAELAEVGL